jgi:hypothetical protein
VPKTDWASAIARSSLLAVVTAALTAPLSLLVGSVVFYAQARLGRVDPRAGFEPNLFLRQVGLPASAAVLVVTFAGALWRLKASGDREIGASKTNLARAKAAAIAAVFAVPLGAMLFVPLWFVLAFLSRLVTGQIHRVTFVLAGVAAAAFMVWAFRLAFGYFGRGHKGSSERS